MANDENKGKPKEPQDPAQNPELAGDWNVHEGESEALHGRWRVIYTIAKGGGGSSNSSSGDSSSSGASSPA